MLQEALYPGTASLLDKVSFVKYNLNWQQTRDLSFRAYPVLHSPHSNPHGIKLRWEGRSLAFSGDTEWTANLIDLSADTELFICECNRFKKDTLGHLYLKTLNEHKEDLNTKKIYLTHMSTEMLDQEKTIFERLYDGASITLW
jgi:ribonuclease BN (tRNA processing enzyme)